MINPCGYKGMPVTRLADRIPEADPASVKAAFTEALTRVLTEGEETDLEHSSGLGLWLVYWFVEQSDGRLSFAENDPRGTVARIDLQSATEPEP